MKKESLSPHFHEVTTAQTWVDDCGERQMSLRVVPTTENHFIAHIQESGRGLQSTVNIDELRAQQPDEAARIIEEYDIVSAAQSETSTLVEIRLVNRGKGDKTIGVLTSWSTDAEWENEKAIIEALALTYPDHQIAYIVTPGMGRSTRTTKESLKIMKQDGSFAPMAQEMAEALTSSDLEFDTLIGVSEGGRIAISLAAELGVESVITVDPPGTTKQSILTFAKRFGLDEAKGQKAVLEYTPDVAMAQAHKDIDSKMLVKQGLTKARIANLVNRAKAMDEAGLATDVRLASEAGATIVDYRASASTFADAQVAADLAKQTPGYNAVILHGAPHAVVEANPYAVVALVQQAQSLIASKKSSLI